MTQRTSRGKLDLEGRLAKADVGARLFGGGREAVRTLELLWSDPVRGLVVHARFLREALDVGEARFVLYGYVAELVVAGGARSRRHRRTDWLVEQITNLATEIGTRTAQAWSLLARGFACFYAQRFSEALPSLRRAEQLFNEEHAGTAWDANIAAMFRYIALEYTGGFRELVHEAPERARRAIERDDRASAQLSIVSHGSALLVQDRPAHALETLSRQAERLAGDPSVARMFLVLRRTEALLYQGDGVYAFDFVNANWDGLHVSYAGKTPLNRARWYFLRARSALAAFRQQANIRLLKLCAKDAARLTRLRIAYSDCVEALVKGALAMHQGHPEAAKRWLGEGRRRAESHGFVSYVWYARYALGCVNGGFEGECERAAACAELTSWGIVNPERWLQMFVPLPDPCVKIG